MQEDKELIKELQKKGMLKKKVVCAKCGENVDNLVKRKRNKDGNELMSWRCKKCQTYKSVKENSFFSLYKKSVWLVIAIIKYWCVQLPLATVVDLLKLEEEKNGFKCCLPIVGRIYKNLRSICSKSMMDVNIKLGGENKDVEIDESFVAKVSKKIY